MSFNKCMLADFDCPIYLCNLGLLGYLISYSFMKTFIIFQALFQVLRTEWLSRENTQRTEMALHPGFKKNKKNSQQVVLRLGIYSGTIRTSHLVPP